MSRKANRNAFKAMIFFMVFAVQKQPDLYGPGYRVYFVQMKTGIVLLLRGGSKKTQKTDIEKAWEYWSDYKDRQKETDSDPNEGIQKMPGAQVYLHNAGTLS